MLDILRCQEINLASAESVLKDIQETSRDISCSNIVSFSIYVPVHGADLESRKNIQFLIVHDIAILFTVILNHHHVYPIHPISHIYIYIYIQYISHCIIIPLLIWGTEKWRSRCPPLAASRAMRCCRRDPSAVRRLPSEPGWASTRPTWSAAHKKRTVNNLVSDR